MTRRDYKHWTFVIFLVLIGVISVAISPLILGAVVGLSILYFVLNIVIRGILYIIEDGNID